MNSTSQLDLHPDADSLNAFAERALAAPEREQVLTHLAACSRCRQVIYLAQQAAAEAEVPAARPTPQPVSWFWNWRLAWVPAAAMAAALALMVTFHPWHMTQMPELAKAVPLRDAAVPAPLPQEQVSAGTHKSTPLLTEKSVARDVEFGARRESAEKLAQVAAPSATLLSEPRAIAAPTEENRVAMPSSMDSAQPQASAAQFQPEPAVAAWQQEQLRSSGAYSASANTSQVSQKSMRAEAFPVHASRQVATAGPRMAQQSQAAPSAGFDIGTQQQLTGLTASGSVNSPKLPSGLAVVSRATAQHLTLEIDRAGTLFLSDDSGKHWEQVAQQWTGRAVEVRAKTSLSGNTALASGFELQNDAGSTWASVDGKTWTAQ